MSVIFSGSSQKWTIIRGYFYLCILGSFHKVIVQNGDWVAKISNNFLGWLKFLIFSGGER